MPLTSQSRGTRAKHCTGCAGPSISGTRTIRGLQRIPGGITCAQTRISTASLKTSRKGFAAFSSRGNACWYRFRARRNSFHAARYLRTLLFSGAGENLVDDLGVFLHLILVAREHPYEDPVVCLDALESRPERSSDALLF